MDTSNHKHVAGFIRNWRVTIMVIVFGAVGVTAVYFEGHRADAEIAKHQHQTCEQGRLLYQNQRLVLTALSGISTNLSTHAFDKRNQALARALKPLLMKALHRLDAPPITCRSDGTG